MIIGGSKILNMDIFFRKMNIVSCMKIYVDSVFGSPLNWTFS